MEKRKYDQAVSEYKKWRSFIKTVVGRNITALSKKELDNVQSEYVEIVNASEISNGIDEIDDVWNEADNEIIPDKNAVNITVIFLLMMIEV